jgi:hypothetical protein
MQILENNHQRLIETFAQEDSLDPFHSPAFLHLPV